MSIHHRDRKPGKEKVKLSFLIKSDKKIIFFKIWECVEEVIDGFWGFSDICMGFKCENVVENDWRDWNVIVKIWLNSTKLKIHLTPHSKMTQGSFFPNQMKIIWLNTFTH